MPELMTTACVKISGPGKGKTDETKHAPTRGQWPQAESSSSLPVQGCPAWLRAFPARPVRSGVCPSSFTPAHCNANAIRRKFALPKHHAMLHAPCSMLTHYLTLPYLTYLPTYHGTKAFRFTSNLEPLTSFDHVPLPSFPPTTGPPHNRATDSY